MEASGITNVRPEANHQGPKSPGGAARGEARQGPSWIPGGPPRCPLRLYLSLAKETPNIDLLFPFSSMYHRRRCFKIGAARRLCPGTLPEGVTSESPSISMDASRMCRE